MNENDIEITRNNDVHEFDEDISDSEDNLINNFLNVIKKWQLYSLCMIRQKKLYKIIDNAYCMNVMLGYVGKFG